MKRFFILLSIALVTLFSCTPDNNKNEGGIEGRWNASKGPGDYAFSLIFNGNNLDLYIIAWGEHFEGTYTYTDNEVDYTITKASKAWTGVTYGDNGEMESWEWWAGNMDQESFELSEGYDWYPMSSEDLADRKNMFSKFEFVIDGDTATSNEGFMGLTFKKAK